MRLVLMLHKTTGRVIYTKNIQNKVFVEIDQGIADFYFNLIPKYINANKQKYHAHVSIIRYEDPVNIKKWNKYNKKNITITYESIIRNDELYFWLDVQSKEINKIRTELGLKEYPPWKNKFHITIGNKKTIT